MRRATKISIIGNIAHQDTGGGASSVWAVFNSNSGSLAVTAGLNLIDGPGPYKTDSGTTFSQDASTGSFSAASVAPGRVRLTTSTSTTATGRRASSRR